MSDRILIVDDNVVNRKLAASVLECDGYLVWHAADAVEALRAIGQALPDLILMDIAMPGMDGLTLTRLLKGDPKTRSIVVVALTASAMKGDEVKAREAGCDGYISKPIDTRALPKQVASHLKEKNKTGKNDEHSCH